MSVQRDIDGHVTFSNAWLQRDTVYNTAQHSRVIPQKVRTAEEIENHECVRVVCSFNVQYLANPSGAEESLSLHRSPAVLLLITGQEVIEIVLNTKKNDRISLNWN